MVNILHFFRAESLYSFGDRNVNLFSDIIALISPYASPSQRLLSSFAKARVPRDRPIPLSVLSL